MRYRKVSVRVWADDRFMRLSAPQPNAQSLFFYLLTGPHTNCIPGVIMAGEASLAEALGWPIEGFREAFRELLSEGLSDGHRYPLVMADPKARLIFLPRAITHNQPESPNVIKGWKVQWTEVPECELKSVIWDTLFAEMSSKSDSLANQFQSSIEKPKAFGKPSAKPSGNPSPKAMANQEQEQEQEQEKNLALFENRKGAGWEPGPGMKAWLPTPEDAAKWLGPVVESYRKTMEAPLAPVTPAAQPAKPRRGRPPKDRSPEAEAERQQERADADRWIDAARSLLGLDAQQAPWAQDTFLAFRQARKKRGIDQLMSAIEGLRGDTFATGLGVRGLLSANMIERGLVKQGKRAGRVGLGIEETWDKYFAQQGGDQ